MKILVDADACPVKKIIEKIAKKYKLQVIMVSNSSHIINSDYSKHIVVDRNSQAADIAIVNNTLAGDIVITQDYGLASMVLGRGAKAIHPDGKVYTDDNIDTLLMQRYLNAKARQAKIRITNPKKRSDKDNERFTKNFDRLITDSIS